MTPQDLELIWKGDPAAWRSIHAALVSVALAAARSRCPSLHGLDLDDIAEDAIEVAYRNIGRVRCEWRVLKGFVAAVARRKARDRERQKAGKRNIEGLMDSLEERLDTNGDDKEFSSGDGYRDVLKAETAALIAELFALFDPEDLEIVLKKQDKVPEKQIAAEHGKGVKSIGNLHRQARRRIEKILFSDIRALPLLQRLGYNLPSDE